VQSGVIGTELAPDVSCADVIRASIEFVKSFCNEGWIAGSSPAMTVASPFTCHARACRGHPCLVSSCGKDVNGRDVSAFTRVFGRAVPGNDGGRCEAERTLPAPIGMQPPGVRNSPPLFPIVFNNGFCNRNVSAALSRKIPITAMWSNGTMRHRRPWFRLTPAPRARSYPPPCGEGRREAPGWGSCSEISVALVTKHRITPTPNPSPAGCGLARFRQISKGPYPGKPGLVGEGSKPISPLALMLHTNAL
jgi:hypothetical protein